MPELAEVEFFRKQWNPGLGRRVERVHLHAGKRIFRGADPAALARLKGCKLTGSEAAGKQMLFRFGSECWVGIHLGMTGKLSVGAADYGPGAHDHLVLYQRTQALVFSDPRQFGRVSISWGRAAPEWWTGIAPGVTSAEFTLEQMNAFLDRRKKLPIKAILLLQERFPGVGNWMADEILWRSGVAPARTGASLSPEERKRIWKQIRHVARIALETIGIDFGDPPAGWLFHERWTAEGRCPKHQRPLRRTEVGGRTTAWCPRCQPPIP